MTEKRMIHKIVVLLVAGLVTIVTSISSIQAQGTTNQDIFEAFEELNVITTAVPFLMIAPDSRSGAMGDAGVAISPDANSIHWNPSKLAFVEDDAGFSISYNPWLKNLVPDINMAYLSGYKRIDEFQTVGASFRYFSLGDITFTDVVGNEIRTFKPNELALDLAYSRKLSDNFSGGIALRYIYSNLTGGIPAGGIDTKPGQSVAADVSWYYTSDKFKMGDKDALFAFGMNVSNIGAKMAYSDAGNPNDFIPTNLRLGPALTIDLDDYNSFTFTADFNKLLVPSPPIYRVDDQNRPIVDPNTGDFMIASGMDPNRSVANALFTSFYDAPGVPVRDDSGDLIYNDDGSLAIQDGSRFREELQEINIAVGMEYWYENIFALRFGYFHEHYRKGARRFFTVGAGIYYSSFGLDIAYLIPTIQQHPLANTIRFSLKFNFGGSAGLLDD